MILRVAEVDLFEGWRMYAEEIVARESIVGSEILVMGWAGRASIAVRK